MPMCPTCGENADHKVYENDTVDFPAGPSVRICHANDGAYLHISPEQ